jgi:aldehyde dehydrogenase (NAD+)
MEVANNVQAGTVWINSCFIERGVETRKFSGNYHISGVQSLLNFMKPKWQTQISSDSKIDQVEKELKSFGALSVNSSVPLAESLDTLKTYKIYVGGKQARPDTQGSRSVYIGRDETKKVSCLVADSSRKDVRNAVEAAASALNE